MAEHLTPMGPDGPLTRERFSARLERRLPGKENEPVRRLILLDADAYGAFLIEMWARPDDRWAPVGDGSGEGTGGAA